MKAGVIMCDSQGDVIKDITASALFQESPGLEGCQPPRYGERTTGRSADLPALRVATLEVVPPALFKPSCGSDSAQQPSSRSERMVQISRFMMGDPPLECLDVSSLVSADLFDLTRET